MDHRGRSSAAWQSWPLDTGMAIRCREHAGVGTLDLVGPEGRLAHWRYTAAVAPLAERLAQRFDSWRASQAGRAVAALESICPSCGAAHSLRPGQVYRVREDFSQSRVSALYRLISFARPVAGLIALGLRAYVREHFGRVWCRRTSRCRSWTGC